jgi:hypothetical protein
MPELGEIDVFSHVAGVKDGPDGWLWFTNKSGNSLGRIFAGGYAAPRPSSRQS